MSDTTANRGYPYSESTDPPAGHTQIQALAEAVDADVAGLPILQAKKTIIAAEQSRTNTAYGYLGTEDKVTGIVLPTNGLIVVGFHALWKQSAASAAKAALFLGSDQATIKDVGGGAPAIEQTLIGAATDSYAVLASSPVGLASSAGIGAGSDVTTGQILGMSGTLTAAVGFSSYTVNPGLCVIFAAAGTYDVGVQFKAQSGSVTAKERKLWVWTMAFD